MLKKIEKKSHSVRPPVAAMVEQTVGCKWTLAVLGAIGRGVRRPGALEREVAGISAKVLNDRLRKLMRFGILERQVFPEVPPRVEYELTPFGERFTRLMDEVARLESDLARD